MTLPEVTWDTLDWAALERLRAGFLAGDGAAGAYWQSAADVAAYDLTFAQRIAWKWEAVLAELRALLQQPQLQSAPLNLLNIIICLLQK